MAGHATVASARARPVLTRREPQRRRGRTAHNPSDVVAKDLAEGGGRMEPSEAIRRIFSAWETNDPDGLAQLFTDDGVYEDPLKPARLEGRDDVRAGNAPAMAALGSCRIDVARVVEHGDVGFCEGFFASSLADGSGRLDFPFAMVVEMRDGLVARCGEYFDTRPLIP
jgi:uncharacterized protein